MYMGQTLALLVKSENNALLLGPAVLKIVHHVSRKGAGALGLEPLRVHLVALVAETWKSLRVQMRELCCKVGIIWLERG